MQEFKTFGALDYARPDFEEMKTFYQNLVVRLKSANSFSDVQECIRSEEKYSSHLSTVCTIAHVRHTIDTTDKFYEEEDRYINSAFPEVMPFLQEYELALLSSPFKAEIDKAYGEFFLKNMQLSVDSFSEKNIALMQEESELCNRYQKLMASCKVRFNGEECNLYGLMKYFSSDDRAVRKAAWERYGEFFKAHEPETGKIFDRLVKVRHQMGVNMGFQDFVPLGYMLQGRLDYNETMVASFREQVKEVIVPFCEKLYQAQAKRIGVDKIKCYDEEYIFTDGNAVPIGDRAYLVEQAKKMYHDMSEETAEFIDFMIDHELMDLDNKAGKAATGYMTSLPDYNAPFVFSCFNGTTGDVDVLTHEMGHAFAGYMAMRSQCLSQCSITTDIAEIHSMSMEQFAYPYAELFFGDKAEKYRFQHLQEALTFVPFGVAVDEFQHIVYKNPNLTPAERTAKWRELEKKYMPWRDYDGNEFFGAGNWWYHKIHIFLYPFYYINYTLTTMGALEFKKKMAEDKKSCWADYMALCRLGGSRGYLDSLKAANVSVPFEKGSVKKATEYAMKILEQQINEQTNEQ